MERDPRSNTLSGLTEEEAKDFHRIFMGSFIAFTLIAIVAHVLVWIWRPWFVQTASAAELQDTVTQTALLVTSLLG
jgi:light-harvesting complex 1 beta chain